MLFNSFPFLLFFICFLFSYYITRKHRLRFLVVIAFSVVFYCSWNVKYIYLLLGTAYIDFWAAQKIFEAQTQQSRKRYLLLSIVSNLAVLGYFKYTNFFLESVQEAITAIGFDGKVPYLDVILPLGISFYTFQSMSYTIDVYRKKFQPIRAFREFFSCVCFFPHLVAGPIVRIPDLHPQIMATKNASEADLFLGIRLIIWGLFKKIVIADNTAEVANKFFDVSNSSTGTSGAIIGALAFTIQIYADFSGYTDMGRGLARMIGIDLCLNFYKPYWADSIQEFWRRWHISLSSWLREYLYISLGGNRKGERWTYINLFLTMLIGGLWHGASFTFILWGAYHGSLLAIERYIGSFKSGLITWKPLRILGTFVLVVFGWVLFRANTMKILNFWFKEFTSGDFFSYHLNDFVKILFFGSFLPLSWMFYDWIYKEVENESMARLLQRALILSALFVICFTLSLDEKREFIYFQF